MDYVTDKLQVFLPNNSPITFQLCGSFPKKLLKYFYPSSHELFYAYDNTTFTLFNIPTNINEKSVKYMKCPNYAFYNLQI